jgi:hypothetical protein
MGAKSCSSLVMAIGLNFSLNNCSSAARENWDPSLTEMTLQTEHKVREKAGQRLKSLGEKNARPVAV